MEKHSMMATQLAQTETCQMTTPRAPAGQGGAGAFRLRRGAVLGVVMSGLLSGCALLPAAGPTAGAFVGNVDESAVQYRDGYLLIPVDNSVLAYQQEEARPSFRG
ncbi:MAG: hypothetical protein CMP81_10360, partial [Fulvimarina sp.]|nr:hypothetical protein [Fulvimarina sp.]